MSVSDVSEETQGLCEHVTALQDAQINGIPFHVTRDLWLIPPWTLSISSFQSFLGLVTASEFLFWYVFCLIFHYVSPSSLSLSLPLVLISILLTPVRSKQGLSVPPGWSQSNNNSALFKIASITKTRTTSLYPARFLLWLPSAPLCPLLSLWCKYLSCCASFMVRANLRWQISLELNAVCPDVCTDKSFRVTQTPDLIIQHTT